MTTDDFSRDSQTLTSPEVVAQFNNGLQQISESLVAIRDGLSSVENDLQHITGAQASLHLKDWKDLRKRFTPVDESFKGTANVLRVFLEAFETTILAPASRYVQDSSDEDSKDEANDEIDLVLEKSANVGKDSDRLVTDFQQFKDRILAFQTKFGAYAEKNQKKADQGLEDLKTELKELQKKRDEIVKKIDASMKKASEDRERFGNYAWIWSLPLLNLLRVLIWLKVDDKLEKDLEKFHEQYEDITSQILTTKAKIAAHTSNTDALDLLLAKLLVMTDTQLKDVTSGVQIFTEVWKAGDSDLKAVQTYLTSPPDTKASVPWVLLVYQQTKRSVYNGIKTALGNFAMS